MATKVGLVSNSNFTAPHAHRAVCFFAIWSVSVSTREAPWQDRAVGRLKLHHSPADNFSRQGNCLLGVAHYQLSGYVTFPISETRSAKLSPNPGSFCGVDNRPEL